MALLGEYSELTPRQSMSLEQSSKSLRIITRLLETYELRGGDYLGGDTYTTNLDRLYEAQANLAFTRLHLSGAIQ